MPKKKRLHLSTEGQEFEVNIKDEQDLLLEKLGISSKTDQRLVNLKAPMPGKVVDVMVSEGETVEKGHALVILEAMKMENLIKASADATIKAIKIKQGDAVEKNQIMIEFQ